MREGGHGFRRCGVQSLLPGETSPLVQPRPALQGDENVELPGLDQRADVTTPRLWKSSGNVCGNRMGRRDRTSIKALEGANRRLRDAMMETSPGKERGGPLSAEEPISFEQHIKPLFRERDRQSMEWAFDLWSHDDVAANSEAILGRLRDGTMPCDGAWPADRIATFERWVGAGTPA